MIDGSKAGTMNMTDDIGTVLYGVCAEGKKMRQTIYRFYGFQHNISFQSHLDKFWKRHISGVAHLPIMTTHPRLTLPCFWIIIIIIYGLRG